MLRQLKSKNSKKQVYLLCDISNISESIVVEKAHTEHTRLVTDARQQFTENVSFITSLGIIIV